MPGRHAARLAVIDQHQSRELETEHGARRVDERVADGRLVAGVREAARERVHDVAPPLGLGRAALRVVRAPRDTERLLAVAPAEEEDDPRREHDRDRHEREPRVAGERLPLAEHEDAQERTGDGEGRADERERDVGASHPPAFAPQARSECRRRDEVDACEREQRDRVQEKCLLLAVHEPS